MAEPLTRSGPPLATVVVQARLGSTRLPGKVLLPFGRSTLLEHILDRLRPAGLDLWVATTDLPEDDAVQAVSERAGAGVHRGSADDVLGRFVTCLEALPERPAAVVRMCADRPLACPELVAGLVAAWDEEGRPDYLSNTLLPSYPVGLDVEVVAVAALARAAASAIEPYDREHVTSYLYRHPDRFSVAGLSCPYGNFSGVRATIDVEADYVALKDVEARLHALDSAYRAEDVLNLATLQPNLFPPAPVPE